MTKDGNRYIYMADGRLERIEHRYDTASSPQRQVLHYEGNRLRLVRDLTYETERYLEFGYYTSGEPVKPPRSSNGPTSLDESVEGTPPHVGKLRRVVDALGRSVEFHYTANGELEHVDNVNIRTSEVGGYTGRPRVSYGWRGGRLSAIDHPHRGASARYFDVSAYDDWGRVRSFIGPNGSGEIVPSHSPYLNESQNRSTRVTLTMPQNVTGEENYTFDGFGPPRHVGRTYREGTATSEFAYRDGSLLLSSREPNGSATRYGYASSPYLRSQSNTVRTTRRAARGLPDLVFDSPTFDANFNFPSGTHTDFDEISINYSSTHGLDVTGIDRGGLSESYTYSPRGAVTQYTDHEGIVHSTPDPSRDGFPRTTTVGGIVTTLHYDGPIAEGLGLVTRSQTPGRATSTHVYNESGSMISSVSGTERTTFGLGLGGQVLRTGRTVDTGVELVTRFSPAVDGFMASRTIETVEGIDGPLTWRYERGPPGYGGQDDTSAIRESATDGL